MLFISFITKIYSSHSDHTVFHQFGVLVCYLLKKAAKSCQNVSTDSF